MSIWDELGNRWVRGLIVGGLLFSLVPAIRPIMEELAPLAAVAVIVAFFGVANLEARQGDPSGYIVALVLSCTMGGLLLGGLPGLLIGIAVLVALGVLAVLWALARRLVRWLRDLGKPMPPLTDLTPREQYWRSVGFTDRELRRIRRWCSGPP